jgi:hypothetical protein
MLGVVADFGVPLPRGPGREKFGREKFSDDLFSSVGKGGTGGTGVGSVWTRPNLCPIAASYVAAVGDVWGDSSVSVSAAFRAR